MKQIPLTQGQFALVDDEDFEELNKFKWQAMKDRVTYYAVRTVYDRPNKKQYAVLMHRFILGLTDPKIQGDHIDHNGLNNQRSNLRVATRKQNIRNSTGNKKAMSIYKGVTFYTKENKWVAQISINGKNKYLGIFTDEIEAAKKYDEMAKLHYGEFAYLNFK